MITDTTAVPELVDDAEPTPLRRRATRPQLSLALPTDLESRVATRRAEIIAKLVEIKADVRMEALDVRCRLKAKLSVVGHIIKDGVVDGWANVGEPTKQKLEHWLANQLEGNS